MKNKPSKRASRAIRARSHISWLGIMLFMASSYAGFPGNTRRFRTSMLEAFRGAALAAIDIPDGIERSEGLEVFIAAKAAPA